MTLRQLRLEAAARLEEAGIPQPMLEVRVLLESLGISAERQIIDAAQSVDGELESRFLSLVRQRSAHQPSSYLTGHREFYGLDFIVDRNTLIPRADTETLVDAAAAYIRQHDCTALLDLCTGTGCVGIAIAHSTAVGRLVLADISMSALEVAYRNAAALLGTETAWDCVCGDLFSALGNQRFSVITANPPYICRSWEAGLSREVANEPALALFDEAVDGLGTARRIVDEAPAHLFPGGFLALECDYRQTGDLAVCMEQRGFRQVDVLKDLAGLDRVVCGLLPL